MSSANSQIRISDLHTRIDHLERELRQTREILARETHDSAAVSAELARTRAYAFVAGAAESLARYGFCVIDNVIPTGEVDAIRDEIVATQEQIADNIAAIRALKERGDLDPPQALAPRPRTASSCAQCAAPATRPNRPTTSSGCLNTLST